MQRTKSLSTRPVTVAGIAASLLLGLLWVNRVILRRPTTSGLPLETDILRADRCVSVP